MSTAIEPLATRSTMRGVERYSPSAGDVAVDLSDNTNRWGMPPAAAEALRRVSASQSRYPEPYGETLKETIARYAGVPAECVVTGCGSDDVIDTAIRAFGEAGARIAIPEPTFPMVAAYARANALVPALVPFTAGWDLPHGMMLSRGPRLAYVCSPNNPSGTLLPPASIAALAADVRGLVIVDEAYMDFADGAGATAVAASAPNVLVVRTLSKAFGLAGLRVGYGIAAADVVHSIERARGPYKLSAAGATAGVAALTDGLPWVREHVALARTLRERLADALRARGLDPVPSSANFVFVPLPRAPQRARAMRELGVAVRPYSQLPHITPALAASSGDALRITVGPWQEVERALDALDRAIAAC